MKKMRLLRFSKASVSVDLISPTFAKFLVMTHELILKISHSFLHLYSLAHLFRINMKLFHWRLDNNCVGNVLVIHLISSHNLLTSVLSLHKKFGGWTVLNQFNCKHL